MRKSLWVISTLLLFVAIVAPCARSGSITVKFTCTGDNNSGGPCLEATPTAPNVTFQGPTLEITWYTAANPSPIAVTLMSTWLATDKYSWLASNDGFFIFDDSHPFDPGVFGAANTYLPGFGGLSETGTLSFGQSSATPEPSSLLLFGTSLLGLVPFRRKLFGR
jgi:hypothetical protein